MDRAEYHKVTAENARKGQLRHDVIAEKYREMGFDVKTWNISRCGIDLRAVSPDKTEIDIFELTNWAETTNMMPDRIFSMVNNLKLEKEELQEKYPHATIRPIIIASYFVHLEPYLDYLRKERIYWEVEGELSEE